jgi:hypothetical protein
MINLNNTYWERVTGYISELRVDSRFVLKDTETNKSYGSLRIVSHPDLSPGYLRAIFNLATEIQEKTEEAKLRTIEDYQITPIEMEVYSINENINTEKKIYEAPYKELEGIFGVKIFE